MFDVALGHRCQHQRAQRCDVVGKDLYMHDADGLRRQLQTAPRHLAEFGLAASCGFGRAPERPGRLVTAEGGVPPPDILDSIVRDHVNAVELLHEARG